MVLKGAPLLVLLPQHSESVPSLVIIIIIITIIIIIISFSDTSDTSDTYQTCSQLYDVWCSNKIPLLVLLLQHGRPTALPV